MGTLPEERRRKHCGGATADAMEDSGFIGFKRFIGLVAEWIHFTLFGIIPPAIRLKVYTFLGGYELSN